MKRSLSEENRIIAIGDIHGCICSLKHLIAEIKPAENDQFVFLGDLIDRGAYSKEVVDYLLEFSSSFPCHFLMGNHEQILLEYLENNDPDKWLYNGGQATLDSYGSLDGFDLPVDHLDFFRSFDYYLETENYFFTHGGLDPELSVKDNLRFYKPEELCWQRVHMRTSFIESRNYKWEKTVVCAHTPVSEPVMLEQLIAIDTGCVYHGNPRFGRLTAVILPERRIVQTENCDGEWGMGNR